MEFKDLNVGDNITVFRLGNIFRIEKIERKTKTLLITNNGRKININSGQVTPKDSFISITPTTKEHIKTIKKNKMVDKLMSFSFHRLSYEQLENVMKAISG